MIPLLRIGFVCAMTATALAGQCAGNGLTLATTGGRLGDPFSIALSGTPGVSGLLGFDLAQGPVLTPVGPVCLGLTPALQLQPFALGAAGTFGISGVLAASPAISGTTVFMQAGAADATQPGGFALSNGTSTTLRPPRLFLVAPSGIGTYPGGVVGGAWAVYDVLTGTLGPWSFLPANVVDAISIPSLGWIAFTLGDGTIRAYDASSGNLAFNVSVVSNTTTGHALAVDGTTLLALEWTIAPATLRGFNLTAGGGFALTFPAGSVSSMITAPGSGYVYLPSGADLIPVSLASGTALPPINPGVGAGAYATWIRKAGTLYGLVISSPTIGINAISTATNTTLFPAPVPIPWTPYFGGPYGPLLRHGPGSTGPSLFVYSPGNALLLELSATTFATTSPPVPLPNGISSLELSDGGTEWLMVQDACGACVPYANPFQLVGMNPSTHAMSTVGSFVGMFQSRILTVPSAALDVAFVHAGTSVLPVATDPATTIQPGISLPAVATTGSLRVIVD